MPIPDLKELKAALSAAGSAHHEFEERYLNGVRDELWAGFYAAYVLGRFGDFASPTDLAKWLEATPVTNDWSADAAKLVLSRL